MDESIAGVIFRETHPDIGVVMLPDHIRHIVDRRIQLLEHVLDSAIHDEVEELASESR